MPASGLSAGVERLVDNLELHAYAVSQRCALLKRLRDLRRSGRCNGMRATLALENLFDSPYRVHGSGVDGAGLGAVLSIAGALR